MEVINSIDYLTKIPDELKLKIFSYLNTFDVIQLANIPCFAHLSLDRSLNRCNATFYREYRLEIKHWKGFVSNKLRSELVTSLNINCVYWIPAVELRKCLTKLKNLEHLYAADTQLGLNTADGLLYSTLHLKTLAATFRVGDSLQHFPLGINNLYVHMERCSSDLRCLISQLITLEELRMIHFEGCNGDCVAMVCRLPGKIRTLKKVRVMFDRRPNLTVNRILSRNTGRWWTFHTFTAGTQTCFEKYDLRNKNVARCKFGNPWWDLVINKFKLNPFSTEVSKKMMLSQFKYNECIQYEELNMSCSACSAHLESTLKNILLGAITKVLKKLSINICLAEQENNDATAIKEQPLFKKPRLGASNSLPGKSTLEQIVLHSSSLEELELWPSDSGCLDLAKITNSALGSIQLLVNLNKLTLHGIPVHLSGAFLVDICKECRQLESLRIQSAKQNSNLNCSVALAVRHAEALKDFRYEQPYINVDKLMESFNELKNSKLERVVLKSVYEQTIDVAPFESFLSKNPQLRFLYIFISGLTNTVIQNVRRTMNKYKVCPQKVFVVGKDENKMNSIAGIPIPYFYRREMLDCHSYICVFKYFNEFVRQ